MDPVKTELSNAIDRWIEALRSRDLDRLLVNYDPSVVLFDVKPPFQIRGIPAVRSMWEDCLPCFPERFGYERRDVRIVAGAEVAVAHWIFRITGWPEEHPAALMWFRATVAFRRSEGRWRVFHEHVSSPFDPMTGRVVDGPESA